MALDCVYAKKAGYLSISALQRIVALLQRLGLPIFTPELLDTEELLRGIDEFREHLGGTLCVTLLREIGEPWETDNLSPAMIQAAVEELRLRAGV
jgi:3-dehydroquinate synthase